MYEHLAALYGGPPNQYHYSLYSKWSKYNWGMIITGNIQVSDRHLTLGRDMLVPKSISEDNLKPFKDLALSIHDGYQYTGAQDSKTFVEGEYPSRRNLAVMQLSHAGRQSINFLGGRSPFEPALAPSSIPVGSPGKPKNDNYLSHIFHRLVFQTPRSMSLADIDEVVVAFVRGASLAVQSGFDGIQLHVAHGCEFS